MEKENWKYTDISENTMISMYRIENEQERQTSRKSCSFWRAEFSVAVSSEGQGR